MIPLLVDLLTKPFCCKNDENDATNNERQRHESSLLPNNCILDKVLKAQLMGGVSEKLLAKVLRELRGRTDEISPDFSQITLMQPTQKKEILETEDKDEERVVTSLKEIETKHLIRLIEQGIVSMSFKDLSIMILLQRYIIMMKAFSFK